MKINQKLNIIKSIRTNNFTDPEVGTKIGTLWSETGPLVADYPIKYGVYHNYQSNFQGDYDLSIAVENGNGEEIIIDGEYQIFDVDLAQENPVVATWQKIWQTNLNRAYTFDFEKYNQDGTIQIYIAMQ